MAGVFEHHDRDRFEIHAISFGPRDESEMRRRLEAAFDSFSDVGAESDAAIAARIRALEIDIAIDLKGYTGGARPGILTFRPAPVQAHYLGYPGTMGSSDIDYLIADQIVLWGDRSPRKLALCSKSKFFTIRRNKPGPVRICS